MRVFEILPIFYEEDGKIPLSLRLLRVVLLETDNNYYYHKNYYYYNYYG